MSLLSEKEGKAVSERFAVLPNTAVLAVFTQEFECEYCKATRELAQELVSLSGGKLKVAVYDFVRDKAKADALGIDRIPAVAVLGGTGEDHGIRFFGMPAGYEFASLLEAIEMVSKRESGLSPATREKLKALEAPLNLQVFVTPTCPYCPRAVVLAFRMAMESKHVTASMVEATEFPHLASRYRVSGVPHTVIGDSPQAMEGVYPEAAAVDMVLAVVQGRRAE